MHQRSRPRRREEPPLTPELGRHRASMRPARAEGHFQFRKQPNASRVAFDSACNIGFSAEENSFALEIRQSSSKKASGIPIKELIDEEVSKEREIKRPSPSLIARLMGLDTLPSPVRQQKNMHSCYQTTLSEGFLGNFAHPEDCSQWRSIDEDHEFKDVFEVMETSKIKKHMNHFDNSRGMLKCGQNEVDLDLIRQKFMAMKHLSTDEVLQNSKEFNDAFEVPDSSKDLFVELLQDPNSLFAKHLQDLNCAPPSPPRSKITILKPCKDTKRWSNEVRCKSSKTERDYDWCSHMRQEAAGSLKMHAPNLSNTSIEKNCDSLPHNSLASQHAGRSETRVHPARIVVLKPSLEKARKMAEHDFLTHENFWFSSKNCREIAASRIQELHDEGRNKLKLSHHTDALNHKVKGSREIAREFTRKMRHTISSRTKGNFASKMNPYPGTGDSFIRPHISKLIHSQSMYQIPDPFGEWSNSFSPSSSYSTESSVVYREAQNRLSERRKNTDQFQNMGFISQGSSTLGEILVLSDRETPKLSVDMLNTKNVSGEKLASDEVLGSKGCHLGISSKDAWRDGSSRFLPRSKSLPASCSPKFGDRKRDGGCSTTVIKDVLDMELSVTSDAKFSMPGIPLVKRSEHQNHKSRLSHSVGEESMLPECEIHVNSEGLRKRVHVRDFLDKTLHPAPTDYAVTERNQLINSDLIRVFGDESWHLTTREQQVMQSAFQVSSENGGLFGPIQNDTVIEEKSSDHPQVRLLPSESDMAKSHPISSKDLEQPSPVSVLETPSEDETYSSGCFERLSADLKELRVQLQRLKLESIASYAEETEFLMLSDDDDAGDNHVLLPSGEVHQGFRDDDDRDFTYLLDIIIGSGIHGVDDCKLSDACYSLGCPVDEKVFDKLEKKYNGIASWSRSERKLLFDLINCTLAGLVAPYMDGHPQVTSKISTPAWDREGLIEGLWQMVVKQRKGLLCNQDNKVLEPGWFSLEYDVDLIGIEMERMLSADLVGELVSELVVA